MVGHELEFDNPLLLEPDLEVCHARVHIRTSHFYVRASQPRVDS